MRAKAAGHRARSRRKNAAAMTDENRQTTTKRLPRTARLSATPSVFHLVHDASGRVRTMRTAAPTAPYGFRPSTEKCFPENNPFRQYATRSTGAPRTTLLRRSRRRNGRIWKNRPKYLSCLQNTRFAQHFHPGVDHLHGYAARIVYVVKSQSVHHVVWRNNFNGNNYLNRVSHNIPW